jgi:hypothetical protein
MNKTLKISGSYAVLKSAHSKECESEGDSMSRQAKNAFTMEVNKNGSV